jgi:SAM-dependent methyltransferase
LLEVIPFRKFVARFAPRPLRRPMEPQPTAQSSTEFWTNHSVTYHHQFATMAESLAYLAWRNDQYYPYLELMPLSGFDDKTVLDYGCGPGHDVIGFGLFSRPARLLAADVSKPSLEQAAARAKLHGIDATFLPLEEEKNVIPLPDRSVDYVHSSGVLHHVPDAVAILREFARILRPGGYCRVMVYNYDSIWLHLYTAYLTQIVAGKYAGADIRAAFAQLTDWEGIPISHVYRPGEFAALASQAGFQAQFLGAAVAMAEMNVLRHRFEAIADRRLPAESRAFLAALEFDRHGYAMFQGHYAGIDGCYLLRPAGATQA